MLMSCQPVTALTASTSCSASGYDPATKGSVQHDDFKAKFNDQPTLFASDGGDHILLVAEATRKAGAVDDAAKIHDAFEGMKDFPGVQGAFTFTADSRVGLNGALCEWQVKDGAYVLVSMLNPTN